MTRPQDPTLLARLESMTLDVDGASLPFSRRLARDNGWTESFARRVVREYKRFVYLAATVGHPVTPSDEVDQAWHLHLAYTRHYWDVMCGEILGHPLHHGPTLGGESESSKFHNWYSRTLSAYEAAFGEPPPSDIWPEPAKRFDRPDAFRRIDTHSMILIPVRRAQAASLSLAALVLAGCSVSAGFSWGEALAALAAIAVLIFVVAIAWSRRRGNNGGSGCGGGCGSGGRGSDGDGGSGCGSGCGGCGG